MYICAVFHNYVLKDTLYTLCIVGKDMTLNDDCLKAINKIFSGYMSNMEVIIHKD